jgi:hypothetical protein
MRERGSGPERSLRTAHSTDSARGIAPHSSRYCAATRPVPRGYRLSIREICFVRLVPFHHRSAVRYMRRSSWFAPTWCHQGLNAAGHSSDHPHARFRGGLTGQPGIDVRPFSYIAMLSGRSLSQPNERVDAFAVSPFCWKPVESLRRGGPTS